MTSPPSSSSSPLHHHGTHLPVPTTQSRSHEGRYTAGVEDQSLFQGFRTNAAGNPSARVDPRCPPPSASLWAQGQGHRPIDDLRGGALGPAASLVSKCEEDTHPTPPRSPSGRRSNAPQGKPPSAANRIQPCPACPKPQVRSAPARLVFRRSRTPPRVLVPTPKSRSAPTPSPPVARTGPVPGASISFPAHPTAWMALRLISTASVGVASTSTAATLSCRTPPATFRTTHSGSKSSPKSAAGSSTPS